MSLATGPGTNSWWESGGPNSHPSHEGSRPGESPQTGCKMGNNSKGFKGNGNKERFSGKEQTPFRTAVLNQGQLCPQGITGNVCRHFWLSSHRRAGTTGV